ncbi:DNA primase small subunit PriS [Halapricum salinum]|uniref:DNA primase small subunit PriS n=1 Tax=Halapricum salinum TaxID=1457250 RepID=A0A4D6HF82_9EURY|nr:DNA primase small subunit PriS [Halapricum salinum]QCC52450.1 DNA primase catalytic subunit PriS [Halapricum salinum]
MEERTRAYLRGRFGDYYRRTELTPPPGANEREWGFIPWTSGPGTTMVRHRSLLDLGSIEDFLARKRPRHVYFSAGRYDEPSASSMSEKGWRSSDLVFDLDADHLPSVTLGEDSYAEMLAKCKDALLRLLDFLEDDFGFEDLTIVFSGGRGYHVHVRDAGIQGLEREARREVVDYVRGIGLDIDEIQTKEMRGNTPARVIEKDGGWGSRIHQRLTALSDDLKRMDNEEALGRLSEIEGVGDKTAKTILGAVSADQDVEGYTENEEVEINYEAISAGNIELGGVGMRKLIDAIAEETVSAENAPIDEPVTTDTNRLIRLPGSLHGGSGLAVRRIDRSDLADFDPLVDAVPETFVGHEISVEVTDGGTVELRGDSFTVEEGVHSVPEYLGVFLMARGRAEKGQE